MTKEQLVEKLFLCLGKEYQSVWLIDAKTGGMEVHIANESQRLPGSIEAVVEMNNYMKAAPWYIDHYVVEQHRNRLRSETRLEVVLDRTAGGESYRVEYGRIGEGKVNYNQLCYDRIYEENGDLAYIFLGFRNIDMRKHVDVDDVTGLYTRTAFFKKAEKLLKRKPNVQFDIVISDIVDFKKINESYGVKTGDKILHWMGGFWAPYITEDFLVGRYGGDQIVIIGPHDLVRNCSSKDGAEKFLKAEAENGFPPIVTKFGIYENVSHTNSVVSSCDKAHVAVNSIKEHYEKVVAYYDEKIKYKQETQRKIEDSMYESLKNGDFKVYYQPKHDAITGKLVGAEALIRWIHPEYGFMSPADFVPLFERNGFVVEIDRYVWKKTCENLRRWADKGINTVPISINASKLTFSQEDLLKHMQIAVTENEISPRQLHIEITETLMTDDVEDLIRKLTAMRAIGYQIELDDFGAGYSSINILSTLPLDVIKLDMSFMKQFGDEKRAKVLAACINLAKELGYKTVSEGVEQQAQMDVLGILGVDIIQGYLFAKPMPTEEFENYMNQENQSINL